jgi:hypothetical protein
VNTSTDPVRIRMAAANPVPPDAEPPSEVIGAAALLDLIDERSGEMTHSTKTPLKRPAGTRRRPRKWAWALSGGFVSVILAVGVVVLVAGGESPDVAGGSSTATTLAGSSPNVTQAPAPNATATVPPATAIPPVAPVPATAAPTTIGVAPPVAATPFAFEGWELTTPDIDLGTAGGSVFHKTVATDFGFLAISGTSGDGIWTSLDGVEWTQVGYPEDPVGLGVGVGFNDLAANGGRIAAVINDSFGILGGGAVAMSTDGENWTITRLPEPPDGDPAPASANTIVAYGANGFIASGGAIWLSTDGEEFQLVREEVVRDLDPIGPIWASASDGRKAVLGGPGDELLVTQDGETWKLIPRLVAVDGEGQECSSVGLNGLAHGPAGFVAVGDCGQHGTAWTSPDGFVWSQIPYDDTAFGIPAWPYAITASERGYVAGGHSGPDGAPRVPTVWISSDGVSWTRVVLDAVIDEDGGVLGLAIYDNALVAVGWVDNDARVWHAVLVD